MKGLARRWRVVSAVSLGIGILALAPHARAATLQLVMDDLLFDPGDTITIRLVGDSQGAIDKTLWAAVEVDRSVLLDAHVDTFAPQTNTTLLTVPCEGVTSSSRGSTGAA